MGFRGQFSGGFYIDSLRFSPQRLPPPFNLDRPLT